MIFKVAQRSFVMTLYQSSIVIMSRPYTDSKLLSLTNETKKGHMTLTTPMWNLACIGWHSPWTISIQNLKSLALSVLKTIKGNLKFIFKNRVIHLIFTWWGLTRLDDQTGSASWVYWTVSMWLRKVGVTHSYRKWFHLIAHLWSSINTPQ